MCSRLRDLQNSVVAYAGQFDAQALTAAQAEQVVELCARIEASAASVKALAAARAAEGAQWKTDGFRSAADHLAHQAGMSPTAAKRLLETGRRLAHQPELAREALSGELSIEQASAVADGVAADPSASRHLIDRAKHGSLPELNEEVSRVKAANDDPEVRRQALHAKRSFRSWTDRDGFFHAHLVGHPEDGAQLWRMLDPIRRRLHALAHESGTDVALDALDYDALHSLASLATGEPGPLTSADLIDLGLFPDLPVPLASSPSGADPPGTAPARVRRKKLSGSPLRVMVRVDLKTLMRGAPVAGELCDIAGFGPVPVSVVEDILATKHPFLIGIMTKGRQVTGVYHHGRHPDAFQRSALDFLHPTCAVEGCPATTGLQYDHRIDYAETGVTGFDQLDRLCRFHHGLKTRSNWALIDGQGKRAFVSPDDPRHPNRRPPSVAPDPTRCGIYVA